LSIGLYRQKPIALSGAGNALGLRGGYSFTSIVNYRRELKACFKPISPLLSLYKVPQSSVSLRQATASANPRKA
jgi:hypothetical protein